MSRSVDERVVQMTFENQKFESNAKQTLSTLDKLKESLNFSGTEKSLDTFNNSITSTSKNFSAFKEIAIGALRNIGEEASEFAINLVKSLTFDQFFSGFSAYETELKTIQVMMSATGKSIEEIETALEEVAWYTDETSYSYDGLTATIKNFLSQNIELKDAISYVQGIANMAGLAGAEATNATHAMEGFGKAIGQGAMSKQLWSYVRTAGMETAQVKQMFIDAAVEVGTLGKAVKDTYAIIGDDKGKTVSLASFDANLSTDWLTTKVMLKAMGKMSEYSEIVYDAKVALEELYGETLQTSDVMDILGDITSEDSAGFETIKKVLEDFDKKEYKTEEAIKRLNDLLSSTSKLGFENAQVYRTFTDAINSTKTAVTSAWRAIFKDVFGNVLEARETWTRLGTWLYDTFAQPFWDLEELISGWKDLGGRTGLIEGFALLGKGITKRINIIKNALSSVFGVIDSKQLLQLTNTFQRLAGSMVILFDKSYWTDKPILTELGKAFENTIVIFGSALKTFGKFISDFWSALRPLRESFGDLFDNFILLFNKLTGSIISEDLDTGTKKVEFFSKVFDKLLGILKPAIKILSKIIDLINNLLFSTDSIESFTNEIKEFFNSFSFLNEIVDFLKEVLEKIEGIVKNIFDTISSVFSNNGGNVALTGGIILLLKKTLDTGWLMETWVTFKNTLFDIKTVITDTIDDLQWTMEAQVYSQYVTMFMNIAKAILMIAGALVLIASIDENKLMSATGVLTGIIIAIGTLVKLLTPRMSSLMKLKGFIGSGITNLTTGVKISSILISIGIAIIEIAAALKMLASIDPEAMVSSLLGLGGALLIVYKFFKLMQKGNMTANAIGLKMMAQPLTTMGFALIEIAIALRILSGIKLDEMAIALGGVIVVLYAITKLAKSFSKDTFMGLGLENVGGMIAGIGFGLIEIALALKIMGSMNFEQMAVALVGVFGSIYAITNMMNKIKGIKNAQKFAIISASFLMLAPSLIVLAAAIRLMGTMDIGQMTIGLITLMSSLFFITNIMNSIKGIKNAQKFAIISASFLMLAPSILVLAGAMKLLSSISWDQTALALITLYSLITIISTMFGVIKKIGIKEFAVFSASLLLLSPSLLIFAAAIASLALIDASKVDSACFALISFIASIGVMAALLAVIPGGILAFATISVSLIAMSAGILVLSTALAALSAVPIDKLIGKLGQICMVLITLGAAVGVIGILGGAFTKLALALLIFATAIFIVGKALPEIATGIGLLSAIGDDSLSILSDFFAKIFEALFNALDKIWIRIVELVAKILDDIIHILKKYIDPICEVIELLITRVIDAIIYIVVDAVPKLLDMCTSVINSIIMWLSDFIPYLIDSLFKLLIDIINGVAEAIRGNSADLGAAIGNLTSAVIEGLVGGLMGGLVTFGEKIKEFGAGIVQKIKDFFNGDGATDENEQVGESIVASVSGGIDNERDGLLKNVENLSTDVVETMDKSEEAEGSGQNTLTGLISGLTNSDLLASIYESGVGAGSTFMAGYNSQMNINSPSKEMAKRGVYTIQGLIQGIESQQGSIKSAAEETASNMLNSLSYSIAKAESVMEDDLNPVITPVLDLSNVESQAGKLSGYFGSRSIKTAASINAINQNGGSGTSSSGSNNTVSVNFTVNKAGGELTDADIRKYGNTIAKVVNERLGFQV